MNPMGSVGGRQSQSRRSVYGKSKWFSLHSPSSINVVESNGVFRHTMKLHGSFGKGLPSADVIDVSGDSLPAGMRKK